MTILASAKNDRTNQTLYLLFLFGSIFWHRAEGQRGKGEVTSTRWDCIQLEFEGLEALLKFTFKFMPREPFSLFVRPLDKFVKLGTGIVHGFLGIGNEYPIQFGECKHKLEFVDYIFTHIFSGARRFGW